MEKLKTYGLALAVCGSLAQVASGAAVLDLGFNKTHYFTGAYTSRFAGGTFEVGLFDGTFSYQLCYGALSFPFPVPIDPIACPLGSTGFVAAGDLNGDGVQDALSYWSIVTPVPAVLIQPFQPADASLLARPSRELPLLQNFKDSSVILYYNLMDPGTFSQYNISGYTLTREYAGALETQPNGRGALSQMNNELIAGQYIFQFPRLKADDNDPTSYVPLGLNITPDIEALDPAARYPSGFRYTSGTWDPDFFYQMDPRVTNKITWTGNTANLIRSGDGLYFAIYDPAGAIQYPSMYYADQYLVLSTPAVTSYTMPPLFFQVGQEEEMRLQFRRNAPTTSLTFDVSVRDFRAKLRFVDSFKGFAALNFPVGTAAARLKPTADYDGDGISNVTEFAAEYPTLEQISYAAFSTVPPFFIGTPDPLFVKGDDNPMDPVKRKVVKLDYSADNVAPANLPPVQNKAVTKGLDVNARIDTADNTIVCDVVKRPYSGTSLTPSFSIRVPSTTSVPRYKKVVLGADWKLEVVTDTPVDKEITAYTAKTHLATGVVDEPALQTFTVSLTKTYWRLRSTAPAADPTTPPEFLVTVADTPLK